MPQSATRWSSVHGDIFPAEISPWICNDATVAMQIRSFAGMAGGGIKQNHASGNRARARIPGNLSTRSRRIARPLARPGCRKSLEVVIDGLGSWAQSASTMNTPSVETAETVAPHAAPGSASYVQPNTHSKTLGYLLWIFGFTGSHRFYFG